MKHYFLALPILFFCLLTCSSCADYLNAMKVKDATEAEVTQYASDDKEMRFIGIAHIAKPALYASIKEEITKAKSEGYVLFWEYIDFYDATEIEQRKCRKFTGFLPTLEGHARESKEDIENGYAVQDNDMFLNLVNDKDYNVDITPTELIKAYEAANGEIILTPTDLSTPIEEPIDDTLPFLKVTDIILGYRNAHIATEIERSTHDKIVVLYGALHQGGVYDELRKKDKSWSKK